MRRELYKSSKEDLEKYGKNKGMPKGYESFCYVFDKEDKLHVFSKEDVKSFHDKFKEDVNFSLSFNTNDLHLVQFLLKNGNIINYPIHYNTLWTANQLIQSNKVKCIFVKRLTKKKFEILREYC